MFWPGKGWVRVAAKADNLVLKGSQRKPAYRPQKNIIIRNIMKRLRNEDRFLSWQFLEKPAWMWLLARPFAKMPNSIRGAFFVFSYTFTTLSFGPMLQKIRAVCFSCRRMTKCLGIVSGICQLVSTKRKHGVETCSDMRKNLLHKFQITSGSGCECTSKAKNPLQTRLWFGW